jgi:hypothetical protein
MNIQIFDVFGRVVKSINQVADNVHGIQANELTNGVYLVRISNNQQTIGELKWIKQ